MHDGERHNTAALLPVRASAAFSSWPLGPSALAHVVGSGVLRKSEIGPSHNGTWGFLCQSTVPGRLSLASLVPGSLRSSSPSSAHKVPLRLARASPACAKNAHSARASPTCAHAHVRQVNSQSTICLDPSPRVSAVLTAQAYNAHKYDGLLERWSPLLPTQTAAEVSRKKVNSSPSLTLYV